MCASFIGNVTVYVIYRLANKLPKYELDFRVGLVGLKILGSFDFGGCIFRARLTFLFSFSPFWRARAETVG